MRIDVLGIASEESEIEDVLHAKLDYRWKQGAWGDYVYDGEEEGKKKDVFDCYKSWNYIIGQHLTGFQTTTGSKW
ncbi:hypothetical protein Lser_V15G03783 [Lactuca serriola]